MDLAAADVPRGPAAHRQPPGPQARPKDSQKHACQARDEVSRISKLWIRIPSLFVLIVSYHNIIFINQMRERRLRMHGCDQAGPDVRPLEGVRLQPEEAGLLHKRLWSHRPQG